MFKKTPVQPLCILSRRSDWDVAGFFVQNESMSATIEISVPEELVKAIGATPADLPRRAFEALVSEAYRAGRITHAQAGKMLELDRWQTDAFLKEKKAFRACEGEDFASDLDTLRSLATK
jgi:hypothetical protein